MDILLPHLILMAPLIFKEVTLSLIITNYFILFQHFHYHPRFNYQILNLNRSLLLNLSL